MSLTVFGMMVCYMLISSFTPGPGNILSMNTMTQYGWKKGKILLGGICCGYLCVEFLCTIMIYGLHSFMAPALQILKYVGAAYLLWLGLHIMRDKPGLSRNNKTASFQTGFLLQLVNVKIYFYIMTLLTVYFVPYLKTLIQLLLAGIGVVLMGSIASLAWAFLGIKLQAGYQKWYRPINAVLGLFLFYCAWGIIKIK